MPRLPWHAAVVLQKRSFVIIGQESKELIHVGLNEIRNIGDQKQIVVVVLIALQQVLAPATHHCGAL